MNTKKFAYQFKVSLKDIEPAIWRRIEVPASYNFWDLHVAIQDSMGWLDYHLHAFRIFNPDTGKVDEIGIPDDDPLERGQVYLPGWELPLVVCFRKPNDRADYEYDLGDGWEHEIVLEEIVNRVPRTKYPKCIGGARACPPEDCGGTWGYGKLLKTIRNPSHAEYESMMNWLGGKYDPKYFDPAKIRFDNPKKRWKIVFNRD